MNTTTEMRLVQSHSGRVLLHIMALVHDHKIVWHLKGIVREIKKSNKSS